MSLVAALLVGSSAFALENTKVSGNANLFYGTDDHHGDGDLFDKAYSFGQASLVVGATADLSDSVSAGVSLTALSTLGLEGQLVNSVWEGTNVVSDYYWYDEAYLVAKAGNSLAKVGRQALDTPLVFTEDWSVAKNTFEAAVAINKDLPGTTLVGAYVGASNGSFNTAAATVASHAAGKANVVAGVNANGTSNFTQFHQGAYALGVVNNSVENLTAQLWYYNATKVLTAHWLQADLDLSGITVGFQYTGQDASALNDALEAQTAMAVKVGYSNHDNFHAYVAYSAVDDATGLGNVGANLSGSGQSKLYTEAWWTYGVVSASDTTAITLEAEYAVKDLADFGFFYTMADNAAANNAGDLTELTLTASKAYGALDTTLAVMNETKDGGDAQNALQVFLTYNF